MVRSVLFGLRVFLLLVAGLSLPRGAAARPAACDGLCLGRVLIEQVTVIQGSAGFLLTGGAHWQPEIRLGSRFGLMPRIGAVPVRSLMDETFVNADAGLLVDYRFAESWSAFLGASYLKVFGPWSMDAFGFNIGGRYDLDSAILGLIRHVQITALMPVLDPATFYIQLGAGIDL